MSKIYCYKVDDIYYITLKACLIKRILPLAHPDLLIVKNRKHCGMQYTIILEKTPRTKKWKIRPGVDMIDDPFSAYTAKKSTLLEVLIETGITKEKIIKTFKKHHLM